MATINGTSGNDSLLGTAEYDQIYGFEGDDTLNGGTKYDFLEGGLGNDTYIVDDPGDFASEIAGGGNDSYQSSATSFQMDANVENLYMMTGAINAIGNNIANTIVGNADNNAIRGGAGNDLILGSTVGDPLDGADSLYGEAGDDEIFGFFGNDTLDGGIGNDRLNGREDNDLIIGGDGDDILKGGSDSLTTNTGDDTLDGGSGNDTMYGQDGDDTYYVDNSFDSVIEEINGGYVDTVHSSISYTLGANLENLALKGTSAINGRGNSEENTIDGNNNNNSLFGEAARDYLFGLAGNDILKGGDANDLLLGGTGNDTLDGGSGYDEMEGGDGNDLYIADNPLDLPYEFISTSGIDTVQSSVSFSLARENNTIEKLILTGTSALNGTGNTLGNTLTGNTGNNSLNGDAGNDTLLGGGGIDTLIGGIGDDSLTGGAGADRLTGGTGKDRFVFTAKTEGRDTITDFSLIDDTINVSKLGFGGGLTANAAITAAQFRLGSAAGDSSDRFIYNKTSGALLFDADGTGASAQVQFAQLSTGLAMTNNDIFVIA